MPTLDQLYDAAVAHLSGQIQTGSKEQDKLIMMAKWSGADIPYKGALSHILTSNPTSPADVTGIFVAKLGNFDPLNLNPYLAFDASVGVLKAGGAAAGYLDLVPTWTNQGSASNATQGTSASQPIYLAHSGANYLHLPGVAGNSASVPHGSDVDIVGDIDLRVCLGGPWPVAATSKLIAKHITSCSYNLTALTNGKLRLQWGGDYADSTAAATSPVWVRGVLDVDNGAGGNTVTFYESSDGSNWTVLGTPVVQSGVTSIPSTSALLRIGGYESGGLDPFRGAVYRAQIYAGTTLKVDIDFSQASHAATSFECATEQTVTINKSGNNPALLVGRPLLRFDGVDDCLLGSFGSPLISGRMFLVAEVRGGSRILSTTATGRQDIEETSCIFSIVDGLDLKTYYSYAFRSNHVGAASGLFLQEVALLPTGVISRVNNADEQTATVSTTSMDADLFAIAASAGTRLFPVSLDILGVWLLPSDLTAEQVGQMRTYLNNRFFGGALP